eukprot:1704152-Prymnesium_polylepis.3
MAMLRSLLGRMMCEGHDDAYVRYGTNSTRRCGRFANSEPTYETERIATQRLLPTALHRLHSTMPRVRSARLFPR